MSQVAAVAEPFRPRDYQESAIGDVVKGFAGESRGQLVMACGTGKTLVVLWIAEELGAGRVLLLFPSIHLLRQTLLEWRRHYGLFDARRAIAVCSASAVGRAGRDEVAVAEGAALADVAGMIEVTTSPLELREFLRCNGPRLVFSTYQSSPIVAAAQRSPAVAEFDLSLADEAHRVAGDKESDFATIVRGSEIRSALRLFATATPRVYSARAKAAGARVVSMDDPAFGRVFHRYSFRDAIVGGWLSDYVAVVAAITPEEAAQLAGCQSLAAGAELGLAERETAHDIALLRAMDAYDLRSVVSFHQTIVGAQGLARRLPELASLMPDGRRPTGKLVTTHVNGTMAVQERERALDRLAGSHRDERVLVTNARCLTEGIDVPAIDCVVFFEPRSSEIDIIQAVGRALRKHRDGHPAVILVALVVADPGDDAGIDLVRNAPGWRHVGEVIGALRAHDERLGQALNALRLEDGRRRSCEAVDRAGGDDGDPDGWTERCVTSAGDGAEAESFFRYHVQLLSPVQSVADGAVVAHYSRVLRLRALRAVATAGPGGAWNERLGEVIGWVEREGRVPVYRAPGEEGRLAGWCHSQRRERISGELSAERAARLECLAWWSWGAARADAWPRRFRLVAAFYESEGRYPICGGSGDERLLGAWCHSQRTKHRFGKLPAERVTLLEGLPGWTWEPRDGAWQSDFGQVANFCAREGRYPRRRAATEEEQRLGVWVANQRRGQRAGELSAERVTLLGELPGWSSELHSDAWHSHFQQVAAVYAREGRCPSNGSSDVGERRLAGWCHSQRRHHRTGKLPAERVALLEGLPGWSWGVVLAAAWSQRYEQLRAFCEQARRLPCWAGGNDERQDCLWVNKQRERYRLGKVSAERVTLLEGLPGWSWEPRAGA